MEQGLRTGQSVSENNADFGWVNGVSLADTEQRDAENQQVAKEREVETEPSHDGPLSKRRPVLPVHSVLGVRNKPRLSQIY